MSGWNQPNFGTNRTVLKVGYWRPCCPDLMLEDQFIINNEQQVTIGQLRFDLWLHFRKKLAVRTTYPLTTKMSSEQQAAAIAAAEDAVRRQFLHRSTQEYYQSERSNILCWLSWRLTPGGVPTVEPALTFNLVLGSLLKRTRPGDIHVQLYLADYTQIWMDPVEELIAPASGSTTRFPAVPFVYNPTAPTVATVDGHQRSPSRSRSKSPKRKLNLTGKT